MTVPVSIGPPRLVHPRATPPLPPFHDPLTDAQKARICNYVLEELARILPTIKRDLDQPTLAALFKIYENEASVAARKELAKTQGSPAAAAYERLRAVVRNPESLAPQFGLNANHPTYRTQLVAARSYLKAALQMNGDPIRTLQRYHQKNTPPFGSARENYPKDTDAHIKKRLLLLADPVYTDPLPPHPDPLSIVLVNTHFALPGEDLLTGPHDLSRYSTQEEMRARNLYRNIIASELHRLANNPHTRLVVTAIAAVMVREKGQVIILPRRRGNYGWAEKHSVYLQAIVNEAGWRAIQNQALLNSNEQLHIDNMLSATFIHESQHFLLRQLGLSPNLQLDQHVEALTGLGAALRDDQAHREQLTATIQLGEVPPLNRVQQLVWNDLVDGLEHNQAYHADAAHVDMDNFSHAQLLQEESIVRIGEALAYHGATPKDVARIAPNLWGWYQIHFVPAMMNSLPDAWKPLCAEQPVPPNAALARSAHPISNPSPHPAPAPNPPPLVLNHLATNAGQPVPPNAALARSAHPIPNPSAHPAPAPNPPPLVLPSVDDPAEDPEAGEEENAPLDHSSTQTTLIVLGSLLLAAGIALFVTGLTKGFKTIREGWNQLMGVK